MDKGYYTKKTNRISTKRTRWPLYREAMTTREVELREDVEMEERYRRFKDLMIESLNVATGRKDLKKYTSQDEREGGEMPIGGERERGDRGWQGKTWWDEECQRAVNARGKSFREWKRVRNMESFITYKRMRAETRRVIKRKKRENYRSFVQTINKNSNLKYVWNKMKIFRRANDRVEWNNWPRGNRGEIIEKEIDKLSPPWTKEPVKTLNKNQRSEKEDLLDREITMEELERALRMVKKDSAPGIDHIEYRMLMELPPKFKKELLRLFNYSFTNAWMPREWKLIQVCFIDKPKKEKVRPIALSSCTGKVLERIINERLTWWTERNGIMDPSQRGFRKGKSSIDNLVRLIADVKVGFYEKKKTIAAFLDVESAYDNVRYGCLMEALIESGCPRKITQYVDQWFRDRIVKFEKEKGEYEIRPVNKGLP